MEPVERPPGTPASPKELAEWMEPVVSNNQALAKLIAG